MKINLPNRITLTRLALAVLFFVLLTQHSQRAPRPAILNVAVAIFILAAVTDILDGYIARKRGLETPLGRVLDPFVDKVLVCGAFILYAGPGFVNADGRNVTGVEGWMVVLIVCRELLVTGLRGFYESSGQSFSASLHGKLKMWVQSIAAPTILFIVANEGHYSWAADLTPLKQFLVWTTVVVTALSAGQYLLRARRILEESSPA